MWDFYYEDRIAGLPELLAPGDLLVLFTDGVVETEGPNGEEFGADRLSDVVQAARDQPCAHLIEEVVRATAAFGGSREYADDFTVVALKRLAPG